MSNSQIISDVLPGLKVVFGEEKRKLRLIPRKDFNISESM